MQQPISEGFGKDVGRKAIKRYHSEETKRALPLLTTAVAGRWSPSLIKTNSVRHQNRLYIEISKIRYPQSV